MTEKNAKVPDGMLEAAYEAACEDDPGMVSYRSVSVAIEAAMRWLGDNLIRPTLEQALEAK